MIRQLVGHSALYTLANLFSRGTVLVWLLILPRFLNSADYGALGLIMTVAAFVNVLVPLEVSQAVARYYSSAAPEDRRGWASTAWTFSISMLGLAAVAAFAVSGWLNHHVLRNDAYAPVFRLAIPYFLLSTSFLFVQNQFRWGFRTRQYTWVTLFFALVTLMLSVGLAAYSQNALQGVMLGMLIGAGSGVALGLFALRDTIGVKIETAKLKRLLRFSLPIVPASLSLMISTYGSRFILNDLLTLRDVGLFTWASQLANIPAMLLLGVQAAVTPLVMKHHEDEKTRIVLARTFEAVLAGALWMCVGLGLVAPEFVRLLGYKAYTASGPLVMELAPAYVLLQLYVFFPGFAIAERTPVQLLVSIAGAAATIIFNYLLVRALGLEGAALATLLSSVVFLGLWGLLSNRFYSVPVRWWKVALFVGVTAVCALIGQRSEGSGITGLAVACLLLVALAMFAVLIGLVGVRTGTDIMMSRLRGTRPA